MINHLIGELYELRNYASQCDLDDVANTIEVAAATCSFWASIEQTTTEQREAGEVAMPQ